MMIDANFALATFVVEIRGNAQKLCKEISVLNE